VPAAAPLPDALAAGTTPATPASVAATASRLVAPLPTTGAATTSAPVTRQTMSANSIRIPALSVTAAIGTAPVLDGVLTPPRLPDEVGAWTGSAPLDSSSGEVTLAGHVNWAGMAPFAFARLAYLHPGDVIYTTDKKSRPTAWRVTRVLARPKNQSIDPAAFAGPHGPRMLALITCGGSYSATDESYDDNVYVYAQPAST
jgi:Sortase domain